jgi:hypothetical protein
MDPMHQPYTEDVRTIIAENPSSILLRGVGRSVVLIPAFRSRSDYSDSRTDSKHAVRRLLNAALADAKLMTQVRRVYAEMLNGPNAIHCTDSQVLDAVAEAVALGRIYAVIGDDGLNARHGRHEGARSPSGNLAIDYGALANRFLSGIGIQTDFFTFLADQLPDRWCKIYAQMPSGNGEIVSVTDEGYVFLFDLSAEHVVVAFGTSRYNPARRDSPRMGDFLGKVTSAADLRRIAAAVPAEIGRRRQDMAQMSWRDRFFRSYGHRYDRGHFMSHRQGGGLDINLFPQLADVNQGRGADGVAYRSLERMCAAGNVFCFSRPIYDDGSWVPAQLEYGVFHEPRRMSVRMFPNKRPGRLSSL